MDINGVDITIIQIAWAMLILAAPALCWLCGRVIGVGGAPLVCVVAASMALAIVSIAPRDDEPLHANGHAWREAREVLMPLGEQRGHGLAPFMHGRGSIALEWLVAVVERALTGTANPFRISRLAGAAAAGSTALLTAVLTGSAAAGLAAGCVLAAMPLARMLAVSGSVLAIVEWILPCSLAFLLAAARSGSWTLLAAAAIAAALGTVSHTAMLAWPPALVVAWLLTARRDVKVHPVAVAAASVMGAAWLSELTNAYAMLAERNGGPGLLSEAWRGFEVRNLFVDPSWVSPVLVPLLLVWVLLNLRRRHWALTAATMLPIAIVAVPLFAVMACSSDAVRYQGALLGLIVGLAVAALWSIPLPTNFGAAGRAIFRVGALVSLAGFPLPSMRQPLDPAAAEHRLVLDAAGRMEPGTLIVLPDSRYGDGRILAEFPDFVLPAGSEVLLQSDARVAEHRGPRLVYLGLACISWDRDEVQILEREHRPPGMRPECRALRDRTHPWMVRSLGAADIPRDDQQAWTFQVLSLDEPFGFFEP
jgi:hypothetical protein